MWDSKEIAEMGKKQLKKQAMEELQHVQEVLQRWDPIHVIEDLKEAGRPPDEYDSYAPTILTMLRNGCDEKQLERHLAAIESANMGLEPSQEKDQQIAAELVHWWKSKRESGNFL